MIQLNNDSILFDSQSEIYRSPFGAVPCGEIIKFNIFIKSDIDTLSVELIIQNEKNVHHSLNKSRYEVINNKTYNIWTIDFETPKLARTIFFHFKILTNSNSSYIFYGNNSLGLGGIGSIYEKDPKNYQITVHHKKNSTPEWFKDTIIYQIFPDRFKNGNPYNKINSPKKNTFIYGNWSDLPMYIKNTDGSICRWDFFGGNLKGITQEIEYFKSLNVGTLYLNPIFESASNHRYDTGNYLKIDPILGTEADFIELVQECKKNDIFTILDGVFNHTGRDSIYFNDTSRSISSPFYPWYNFKTYPSTYESWWGITDLPTVNELDPGFLNYIIDGENSVINHWMKIGVKGWRLDVADELPGSFIEQLTAKCDSIDKDSVIIGEVWEDASNKVSYNQLRDYFNGKQLDSVMNYPLRENLLNFYQGKFDSNILCQYMNSFKENYPRENYYSLFNLLGSHDVKRIKTSIKEIVNSFHIDNSLLEETTIKILKSFSLIQFTIPGVPVIYYGDEVGVEGEKDPDNRRTYPWGNENYELLDWYKKISTLRHNSYLLKRGEIIFFSPHPDVFAFIRFNFNNEEIFSIFSNRNRIEIEINLIENFNKFFKNKINLNLYTLDILTNNLTKISNNKTFKIAPLETVLIINK